MSGLTHGGTTLGTAVLGERVVASIPGPAGTVAKAALPFTGIALATYLAVAIAVIIAGVLLQKLGKARQD